MDGEVESYQNRPDRGSPVRVVVGSSVPTGFRQHRSVGPVTTAIRESLFLYSPSTPQKTHSEVRSRLYSVSDHFPFRRELTTFSVSCPPPTGPHLPLVRGTLPPCTCTPEPLGGRDELGRSEPLTEGRKHGRDPRRGDREGGRCPGRSRRETKTQGGCTFARVRSVPMGWDRVRLQT